MQISESIMNGNALSGAGAAAAAAALLSESPSLAPSTAAAATPSSSSAPSTPQLPQALQNLQRLLQSQLANVNPLHLQQALQRQQVSFVCFLGYLIPKMFHLKLFVAPMYEKQIQLANQSRAYIVFQTICLCKQSQACVRNQ